MFCPGKSYDESWIGAATYWPFHADSPLYPVQMNAEMTCDHPLSGNNASAYFGYVDALVYPAENTYGIDGMEVRILHLLADKIGFNINFYPESYGDLDPSTGEWSGFMGKVHHSPKVYVTVKREISVLTYVFPTLPVAGQDCPFWTWGNWNQSTFCCLCRTLQFLLCTSLSLV